MTTTAGDAMQPTDGSLEQPGPTWTTGPAGAALRMAAKKKNRLRNPFVAAQLKAYVDDGQLEITPDNVGDS